MRLIKHFRELDVYKAAFTFQQMIFELSKKWPAEERYALTDQVRRSSRSIGANLAESWAKRRYPAHFLSKLTDADGELQETRHWINSAKTCCYLSDEQAAELDEQAGAVGGMLGNMIVNYESFCLH